MSKTRQRSPLPIIVICGILTVAITGAAIFGLVRLSHYKFFKVASTSMAPALAQGESVQATAIKKGAPIARGQIVVMSPPMPLQSGVKLIFKRVVGLPGDTISSVNGKVEIDGQPFAEPYLKPGTFTEGIPATHLGPGSYFVLGDNRENSADSRLFGPVPVGDIKYRVTGKASLFH